MHLQVFMLGAFFSTFQFLQHTRSFMVLINQFLTNCNSLSVSSTFLSLSLSFSLSLSLSLFFLGAAWSSGSAMDTESRVEQSIYSASIVQKQ